MFIGIGINLTGSGAIPASARYTVNGFQFDLVAHFKSDQYFYDAVAKYTINGLALDLVADFKNDTYASEL